MKRNLRCLLSLLFSTLLFIPLGGARGESLWESQFSWQADRQGVVLKDGGGTVRLASPEEGLWAIALGFEEKAPTDWRFARPESVEQLPNGSVVLSGTLALEEGKILLRDIYTEENGLLRGVRRFEYQGDKPLEHVTLSVRFVYHAADPQTFLPGILYNGNPSGEKMTKGRVPAYHNRPGEFAFFEDHRFPIPAASFEDAAEHNAAALYTLPSPARRGSVVDQWWSLGLQTTGEGTHELDIFSGYVGFNDLKSVVKGIQRGAMDYPEATLRLVPGEVIEKTFWLDLWPVEERGTGLQKVVRRGIELFEPYGSDGFPSFDSILLSKFRFALTRWIEGDSYAGFNMYPAFMDPKIVFGWCGQADSCGFSFLPLADRLSRLSGIQKATIYDYVQRSLDHLSTAPVDQNGFPVIYDPAGGCWETDSRDPVSMGQGMYNFAKAIAAGREIPEIDTAKWEDFFKKSVTFAANRVLADDWSPVSTAEGFFIAPLILAYQLFDASAENDQQRAEADRFRAAAVKAADYYAARHKSMDEPYWGGTLDASCEDKEGAWAAFQGFLTMYEVTGQQKYLDDALHAGEVCLSYLVVWDIPLPPGRLSDHAFKSRGWTVVSVQNQHLDVYGVLFAPEIKRLGELTGIDSFKKVSEVMFRSCGQLIDEFGSQGEQIQQTNFAQAGDMSDVLKLRGGYNESWTVFWITAHFLNAAARFTEYDAADGVHP